MLCRESPVYYANSEIARHWWRNAFQKMLQWECPELFRTSLLYHVVKEHGKRDRAKCPGSRFFHEILALYPEVPEITIFSSFNNEPASQQNASQEG
jgi:hypothetical protein